MSIHDRVRQEMYEILSNGDYRIRVGEQYLDFADKTARQLFSESIDTFNRYDLSNQPVVDKDGSSYIFMWRGDKIVNTLTALLIRDDFTVEAYAGVICVNKIDSVQVCQFLQKLANQVLPTATELAETVPFKMTEKFDEYLPDDLLNIGYGAQAFDIIGLKKWLEDFKKTDLGL